MTIRRSAGWALAIGIALAAATTTDAGPYDGFEIRYSKSGRAIAVWQGEAAPSVEALKAVVLGERPFPARDDLVAYRAPATAPAPAVDAIVLNSLGDVRFEFGSAALTTQARKQLEDTCRAFTTDQELRRVKFHLVGHACSIGTSESNQALSVQRAQRAADFLRGCLGGSDRVVSVEGRGEDDPMVDVAPDAPLQRRVELAFIPPTK